MIRLDIPNGYHNLDSSLPRDVRHHIPLQVLVLYFEQFRTFGIDSPSQRQKMYSLLLMQRQTLVNDCNTQSLVLMKVVLMGMYIVPFTIIALVKEILV